MFRDETNIGKGNSVITYNENKKGTSKYIQIALILLILKIKLQVNFILR